MRAHPFHLPAAVMLAATAVAGLAGGQSPAAPSASAEWRGYGGSNAGDRYSPLAEITPANVDRLEEAWRFDTGETGGFQVNPIVVHGVMSSPTPNHKVVAFEAATGRLLWQVTLPFAANTTPATYEVGGRQYVVVAAGGGKSKDPSGGMFIAYRLRRDAQKGR
jgi:glucose dehydrogenase